MNIGRKLAIGYTVIVALIGGIVYTYLHEWRQMNKLESEVKQIHELRRNIRDAYAHMLDLTMFGETILEWKDADTATYRAKRLEVDSILCRFKNYYSGERIDSLRGLMAEKETQLFYISKLFEQQQELSEELAERVPVIAYESTQEPKTKGGFLGLFKKKDKSQSATSTQLYTLNRDVIKKQSEQSRRLSATADSLAHRNLHINQKLKNLITVMDERITADLQQREQEIIYTRERTKISIGAITAFLFLSLALSYFVIMRDYGRKERGRRKLEESNQRNEELVKMRNKVILTISHDIRGPLNGIYGSAELAMDMRDKKRRNHKLTNITILCKHVLHLVNNLLDVYRLDQAKESPTPVPFRLSELLSRVADSVSHITKEKGLKFKHRYTDTDVVVKGDKDKIERIINNLITNAVKFTAEGYVSFNASYADGKLTMEVSDTGVGISDEMLERIYVPFERATNNNNAEGYGLGLPITKGLVTMLGGTIDVKSKQGMGTTFTVTLPLPITDEPIEENLVMVDVSEHLPKSVIAIDDDILQLEVFKEMLERNAISCTACGNTKELLAEIRKKDYDMVLTDIQMPEVNGYGVLGLLRKSRIGNSKTIPVVAMTAREDGDRQALLDAGFDGCIFKPFSTSDLLQYLASIIKSNKEEHRADFSQLLSEVTDRRKVLSKLIESCEKDITDLKIAMTSENRESMRNVVHRIIPMWEMLSMKEILQEYRNVLKDSDSDIQTVLAHTSDIITHIEHLMEDARKEITRIADEEQNTDC